MIAMRGKCRLGAPLGALAALAALAACDDGDVANGPATMSKGEAAALADAEEMLDERPSPDAAEEVPPAEDGNE
ncbi:hypothetical protein [Aurantiacibacter gilvus]|uniref:Argininosuccinate lyase n=1 Tax=Aurantiacibacter gilvus TaxID=3139141 RepID=A0ABU9IHW9_9SPHN